MALSVADAIKLVQSDLIRGVGESIITEDEFLANLPLRMEDRYLVQWNVEAGLGVTPSTIAPGGSVTESAASFALSGAYIERIVTDVLIPNSIA